MEEKTQKNHSNLPSNYVTLLQLQERWIKEQQRKKQEEEDEQKRKQQEEEEEEGNRNVVVLVENEKSKSGGEETKEKSYGKKKKNKNKNWKNKNKKKENEAKKEENGNADVETSVSDTRERGKTAWKKAGDDVADESDRTVEIAEKLESVKVEEEIEVSRREKRGYIRKSNGKSGYYNGKRYGRRNGVFEGEVGDDVADKNDQTVEIAEKLENVKVEEETVVPRREKRGYIRNGNGKSGYYDGTRYGRRNGVNGGHFRDFRPNENQMVWVKKQQHFEEHKDGNYS